MNHNSAGALRGWPMTGNMADSGLWVGPGVVTGSGWTTSGVLRVISGDFDGDGRSDIMSVASNGQLRAWPSTGDMSADSRLFASGTGRLVGSGWTSADVPRMFTGDFNGDGRTDLIGQMASGQLRLWPSTGDLSADSRLFTTATSRIVGGGWTLTNVPRIITGDFNGDGRTDVIQQLTNGQLKIWPSTGDISADNLLFTSATARIVGSGWTQANIPRIITGDFNGDGRTDIIAQLTDGILRAWSSSGDVSADSRLFPGPVRLVGTGWTVSAYPRIFIGDFNGDGRSDIMNQAVDGRMRAWRSSGDLSADARLFPSPSWLAATGWTLAAYPRIL